MSQYITKDNTDRIKRAADGHVLEVIRDFQDMEEQKGYDYRGKCPVCGKNTFNYNSKKELYGCFNKCNVGGHDALTYLMKVQNMRSTMRYCIWLNDLGWILPLLLFLRNQR